MDLKYLKGVAALKLDTDKCIGCGMCLNVCPHAVFSLIESKAHITDITIVECGACAMNCPVSAISVEESAAPHAVPMGILSGNNNGDSPCGVPAAAAELTLVKLRPKVA